MFEKIKETDLSEKFSELIYWLIYFPNLQFAVVEFSFWKQKSPCKYDDLQGAISVSLYPERGSNPHAFQHRCLRPTCLPIPTSGRKAVAKVIVFFGFCKLISKNFADRYKISNFAGIKRLKTKG